MKKLLFLSPIGLCDVIHSWNGLAILLKRRSITLTLALLIVATGTSQRIIISSNNTYLNGNRLAKQQVNNPIVKESAKNGAYLWAIDKIDNHKKYVVRYMVKNDSFPDRLTGFEKGTQYHYVMKEDAIFIAGYQNQMTRMDYDQPEEYLHLPMALGDSIGGYFHGRGTYGDKLALRNYGWYKTKAEKTGEIILPDGNALCNVLQIHTERLVSSQFFPIAMLDSLRSFSEDSVRWYLSKDCIISKAIIDRWYIPGYRYPILETRTKMDDTGVIPLQSQTLFFPPLEQETQLQGDFKKNMLREQLSSNDKDSNSREFRYEANYVGDRQVIIVQYQAARELRMSYTLCSIDAQVIYQHPEQVINPGFYSDQINVSTFKPGIYVLIVNIDGQHYSSEKIAVN